MSHSGPGVFPSQRFRLSPPAPRNLSAGQKKSFSSPGDNAPPLLESSRSRIRSGNLSSCSCLNTSREIPIWRRLFEQLTSRACFLTKLTAGSSNPAKVAMIEMTTSNSMRVKPLARLVIQVIRTAVGAVARRVPYLALTPTPPHLLSLHGLRGQSSHSGIA